MRPSIYTRPFSRTTSNTSCYSFLPSLSSFHLPAVHPAWFVPPTSGSPRCARNAPISGPLAAAAAARRSIFQQVRRRTLQSPRAASRGPIATILRPEWSPCLYPACMTYTHHSPTPSPDPYGLSSRGDTTHNSSSLVWLLSFLNTEPQAGLYLPVLACCV